MLTLFDKILPHSQFGDRLVSWLHFLKRHRRLPRQRLMFNDELYRIKTSQEILDPLRVFVSDKEYVKLFVKSICGDAYNVPTEAVLRSVEKVRTYSFPDDCCIKPTHASGEVILRRAAARIDFQRIEQWFKTKSNIRSNDWPRSAMSSQVPESGSTAR